MNTNLTEKILQTIDYSGDLIKQGVEFTKEQAPLVVQEFLTWSFYDNLFSLMFLVLLIFLCIFGTFRLNKFMKKNKINWETPSFPAILIIVFVISSCVSLPFFISRVKETVKVKVAPRVYLIEWAAKQIK